MAVGSARKLGTSRQMIHLRRICAHDSARACLPVLALYALCAIAELICTLTGVPQ